MGNDRGTRLDADELANAPLFAALTASKRRAVLSRASRRAFERGELIFHEDATAEGLFFLAGGTVRLTRRAFGRTTVIGTQQAPSTLVPIGLFDSGCNGVTAMAAVLCDVYVIGCSSFVQICMADPDSAVYLLRLCTRRVRQTASLVDMLTLTSVRQRVARWLIEMSEASGGAEINMPVTQKQLAGRLGTVREVLFRNLKHLQDVGIIHFSRQNVVINDLHGLHAAAGIMTPEKIFVASKDRAVEPFLMA